MLRIRLRRVGLKKQPSYRLVVAESTAPRDGKFVEVVGFYNPRTQPETIRVNEARVLHWLKMGALPSDSTERLLKKAGTLDRFARLKAGEPLEALAGEAATAFAAEKKSDKTSVAAPAKVKPAVPETAEEA